MMYIGMIFQYDAENASGLIMLSDGAKKEFTIQEWVDTTTQPAIGQKIAYESSPTGIQIKVATQQEIQNPSGTLQASKTMDEYINDYVSKGFKLVKETHNDASRVAILRSFIDEEPEEVIIKEGALKINVVHTRNGKVVS